MSRKNPPVSRLDEKLMKEINEIKLRRQGLFPKEKLKPQSTRRVTLAIARHDLFKKIKLDIIKARLR